MLGPFRMVPVTGLHMFEVSGGLIQEEGSHRICFFKFFYMFVFDMTQCIHLKNKLMVQDRLAMIRSVSFVFFVLPHRSS